jgi:hypothetical protein
MSLSPVLVHQIFGVLLLVFAIVLLLREIDVLRGPWADYLPAAALLLLGALLFLDPWLFHGGDFGAEGNQHTWQGLSAVAAGVLEMYRARRKSENMLLALVVPAVLMGLGLGFLSHEQHQTGNMLLQTVQHRVMGATLLLAALIKLAANFRWREGQWARTGWLLILSVFALQLLLYTEVGGTAAH